MNPVPTPLPRIARFEKLGFGLFIHYGLPSSHSDDALTELLDLVQTIALGAAQIQSDSWRALAPQVARPSGPGVSVLVFNPLNWEVRGNLHTVTFPVADQEEHHAVESWDSVGRPLAVLRVATHKRAVGAAVRVWLGEIKPIGKLPIKLA